MDNLIFLDTETTGNDLLKDHLFQVCYSLAGVRETLYFKPPVPISIKAQSITHITPKMVEDKEAFRVSEFMTKLQLLLKDNILVAHNAAFDVCMLSKEGVEVPKFICTFKVARFLDEAEEIPEYNLQYLRYFLGIEIEAFPHEAESDVIVLEALFGKLLERMQEKYPNQMEAVEKMVEVSLNPLIFRTFNFGKYKGRKIEEIARLDKGYLEWLLGQKMQNAPLEEDWIFTLKSYLNN